MNSIERIISAILGTNCDRRAFTLTLSLYGAKMINCNTKEYYANPNLWYEGQCAIVEKFDLDILLSPFTFALEAQAWGCEIAILEKNAPNIKKNVIKKLSDINKISIPDISSSQSIRFFLSSTNLLFSKYGKEKLIASPIYSPCDIPALLMGVEMWIDTLLFHPKQVELMMQKTINNFVSHANELISCGTSILVIPINFINPMIVTEKIFNNIYPYLQEAFSQINVPIIIHNGGCKLMKYIKQYSQLPNVKGILINYNESFDEARSTIVKDIILLGNIDGPRLNNFTLESIQNKCNSILENRKDDKHFIFASANADIPYDTSIENIECIVNAVKNYK
jgi:uroporphyrinogen decarboxylase